MALYFPVVGLLIGGLLCVFDSLCGRFAGSEMLAILDVFFLAFVSGGLHLDGLADATDGLLSRRPREKTLEIMRDQRIGAMGALALIFCVLMKCAGVKGMDEDHRWVWLLAAPAFARTAQVAGLVFMDYARKDGGIGDNLFQRKNFRLLLFSPAAAAVPFFLGPFSGMEAVLLFLIVASAFFSFCGKKIGGMTGDTIGALSEIMETCVLALGGM